MRWSVEELVEDKRRVVKRFALLPKLVLDEKERVIKIWLESFWEEQRVKIFYDKGTSDLVWIRWFHQSDKGPMVKDKLSDPYPQYRRFSYNPEKVKQLKEWAKS